MNDLLGRLRYHGNHCLDRQGEQSKTMLEAAHTIERLLGERIALDRLLAQLTKTAPPDDPPTGVMSYHPHGAPTIPKSPE